MGRGIFESGSQQNKQLKSLLGLLVCLAVVGMSIYSIVEGTITVRWRLFRIFFFNIGSCYKTYSMEADPIIFWSLTVFWMAVGLVGTVYSLKALRDG